MATFNEQILEVWEEWEVTTELTSNDPDEFLTWALNNKKIQPYIQDVRKLLRKQITSALRQAMRLDEDGFFYRAKQCVVVEENGNVMRRWFDTDKGGTPNLRQKVVRQKRDAIANDVYRAMCDVEHLNKTFPGDPQLSFFMDFTDDFAEHRAAELAERDKDDEAA